MNLFDFLTWVLSGFWRFVGFAILLTALTNCFPIWKVTRIERDGDDA